MNNLGKQLKIAMVLSSFLLTSLVTVSAADGPQQQMRQTLDQLLVIMGDGAHKTPDQIRARQSEIRHVLVQRFDFREMARRSLGKYWHMLTSAQRQELASLFSSVLETYYAHRVEEVAERPLDEIRYLDERTDSDGHGLVLTQMVFAHGSTFNDVAYLLTKQHNDWKVYDLEIDGVSMASNFRHQFGRILHEASYTNLMQRLKMALQSYRLPSPATAGSSR